MFMDAHAAGSQIPHAGAIVVPDSSIEHRVQIGAAAHTNHLIFVPVNAATGEPSPAATGAAPAGEVPQSLYPVYGLPFTGAGGSGIIVIVDAFDYPTAENDLNVFSSQFGLPPCSTANGCFKTVYATSKKPRADCGWAQEAALDIEWAHAMAPGAKIVLVEAASNSFSDLFRAVDVGSRLIQNAGVRGQVSMSWGGSEFSSEASYDNHFTTPGVVYFASSGDTGGATIYPGTSPNVVSAGGTTITRDASGAFVTETAWSGSGGGPSKYEARPGYQDVVATTVGSKRGAPDLSFDANPASGVSVYDSTSCNGRSGWLVFGGTSVSAPSLAGIVNTAGNFAANSTAELTLVYGNVSASAAVTSNIRDITAGKAGTYTAGPGWDFTTGVGSSLGLSGK